MNEVEPDVPATTRTSNLDLKIKRGGSLGLEFALKTECKDITNSKVIDTYLALRRWLIALASDKQTGSHS
jgi:hypothetical protein